MKAVGVALVIALSLAVVAGRAEAEDRHRRFRGDLHGSRRFERHHPHHHRGFVHRPVFPVFVTPSVVLAPPVIVAPPVVYAPPPVYAAPPVYAPPTSYPAPVPTVVEFPGGRYELRGDGVHSPHAWVWIPNPPAAAPPPPPAAPPADAPEPAPARRPARETAMLYRWTDEQGVTTWTDSLEKIPARHRGQACRLAP